VLGACPSAVFRPRVITLNRPHRGRGGIIQVHLTGSRSSPRDTAESSNRISRRNWADCTVHEVNDPYRRRSGGRTRTCNVQASAAQAKNASKPCVWRISFVANVLTARWKRSFSENYRAPEKIIAFAEADCAPRAGICRADRGCRSAVSRQLNARSSSVDQLSLNRLG